MTATPQTQTGIDQGFYDRYHGIDFDIDGGPNPQEVDAALDKLFSDIAAAAVNEVGADGLHRFADGTELVVFPEDLWLDSPPVPYDPEVLFS